MGQIYDLDTRLRNIASQAQRDLANINLNTTQGTEAYSFAVIENNARKAAKNAIDEHLKSIQTKYDVYNKVLEDNTKELEKEKFTPPKNETGIVPTGVFPPAGITNPYDIKRLWDNLPQWEKDSLIKNHPREIGDANGLPSVVKDQANRAALGENVKEGQGLFKQRGLDWKDVQHHVEDYKDDPAMVKAINAFRTQDGLNTQLNRIRNLHDSRPVLLTKYDSPGMDYHDSGQITIGDPDHSPNIAVMAPGTGNSVFQGSLSSPDLSNMAHEMYAADKNSAVVYDINFRTPDSPGDPAMYQTDMARSSADRLVGDVNGLWASHDSGMKPEITVIGHSYGSTIVADASVKGMHATNDILIGSPGMDLANSASDLHLDGGNAYSGGNSADAVSHAGSELPHFIGDINQIGLGKDPNQIGSGVIRFHSETPDWTYNPVGDHSKYFEKGSEPLYNMVDISTGHNLTDNQIAPERPEGIIQSGNDWMDKHLPGPVSNIAKIIESPAAPIIIGDNLANSYDDPEDHHYSQDDHYHNPDDANRKW